MVVQCAVCGSHLCRGGNRDAGPEFCPMHADFPKLETLYDDPLSLRLLKNAALIEARGYGRWTRLREVAEFARILGFRRVGIGSSPDLAEAAGGVASLLNTYGLGAIVAEPRGTFDPEGQADFLNREGTELNIVAGMGVAAEAVFLKTCHSPSTVLFARDRRLYHNPAAALYTSRSYLQDSLHGHWPSANRPAPSMGLEGLKGLISESPPEGEELPPSRLEEVMSVAHRLGASHLGISFCVGFKEEAKTLAKILEINDFKVSSACCKTGATPKEEVGIKDEEKIRPGRPEMICNPVAQAELLNRDRIDFGLVLGQCVGHDAATFRHLDAPAVCLVAKDRVLAHNPLAALSS